jgi:hypothetical protein
MVAKGIALGVKNMVKSIAESGVKITDLTFDEPSDRINSKAILNYYKD